MDAAVGLMLAVLAGSLLGSFALPMKRVRGWNWENTWMMYSLWAVILLPWALAWYTIPQLLDVFRSVSPRTLLVVLLFGAGWGVANVSFGVGIKLVGLAMGTAILLGMNNALGAILPILTSQRGELLRPAALAVTAGVGVMIAGIVVCALAGARRERVQLRAGADATAAVPRQFLKGLAVCILGGVFGAMFNFALIAGKPLERRAVELGATPLNAPNATWCIALFGGFLTTLAYCVYLKAKNRSWNRYVAERTGRNWLLTFLMGFMWFAGVALFGMAVTRLGRLGPSIGWSIIQSMAVVSGNFWGLVTGEWKGSGRDALTLMAVGLLLLVAGIAVVGWATTLS